MRTRVMSARWSDASTAASSAECRRAGRAPHGAARRLDGARGLLGRAHGPRVRQDLVTQAKLIGLARQR